MDQGPLTLMPRAEGRDAMRRFGEVVAALTIGAMLLALIGFGSNSSDRARPRPRPRARTRARARLANFAARETAPSSSRLAAATMP